MLCDCLEVSRSGGINPEVWWIVFLLFPTLTIFTKDAPFKSFSFSFFFWREKSSYSLGDAYIHFHKYVLSGSFQSTCCTDCRVFLSCYFETGWWIKLSQYLLLSVLNQVWDWMLFTFSRIITLLTVGTLECLHQLVSSKFNLFSKPWIYG